ncbi:ATPase [Nibrella viscosa]|uniref:ATPase n=1 Tax=Nibrella viscosa TaxID=1084524 RepID=A0ABP8KP64_9BACT
MEATNSYVTLLQRIEEYKKRYFLNQLVKGSLMFLALVFSLYLLINTAEFFGRFSTPVRATFFFGFLLFIAGGAYYWLVQPVMSLYGLRRPLSDEEAARQIGGFFPEVGDKLVNTLQLKHMTAYEGELLTASLNQRSQQLLINRFANAIELSKNRRFLKFVMLPMALILFILLFNPSFFTNSSARIVQYDREFVEEAPFQFVVNNDKLQAYRNEDFKLDVQLTGNAVPQTVYLVVDGTRFKLENTKGNNFSYTFDNVQRDIDFSLEASGYKSTKYTIGLIDRPSVLSFDVKLTYPAYLNKPAEQLSNVGNLLVPQGTIVTWNFTADHTDSLLLRFHPGNAVGVARKIEDNAFSLTRQINQNINYSVDLANKFASNNSNLRYNIQVIPDRYPQITVEKKQDTVTYNYIVLGGSINDDYGFTRLRLVANVTREGKEKPNTITRDIPINRSSLSQNYSFGWALDSLKLQVNDRVEYYLQVWDNDGINGPKSTRTAQLNFTVPSPEEVQKQIDQSAQKAEQQMENALNKTQGIKKDLNSIEERLRTKKSTDFQDKKQLADVLKKREELIQQIQQLQEQFKQTNDIQNRFSENNKIQEKIQQLQKLFNELLDPESKKLYEELKSLLEKKQDEKASELLDRLSRKERNFEKDLERALKMFKQLQMEQKLNNIAENLEKQAEKQEQLAKEAEQNKNAEDNKKQEDLKNQQEKAAEEFNKTAEQLKELEQNAEKEDLTKPDTQEDTQKEIQEQMKESQKNLNQKQNNKASESQSKTAKSMKKMSQQLAESMANAEAQELQENIDDLRALLENLISLSFSQEKVMKDFRGINSQDPRVTKLSQEQLKLQDDAKIIEDSLTALAGRVPQIQSFVTRELTDMKYYMDQSVQQLKERRFGPATGKQQFAMTSINNLSLMLSDVLKNMQAQMNSMAMPGKSKGNKKGQQPSMSMGQMQKELNERMKQLQQSGKGGRGMSEELSRLAAEQAMIRKMLKEIEEQSKGTELGKQLGNQLKELQEKMDETETDLVNKRINQNTMNRQSEIMIRLLESEKAIKQQEEDPKRQAEAAKSQQRSNPSYLDSLVPQQSKQTEVLRTVNPSFNQYYKKEANKYLQKVTR